MIISGLQKLTLLDYPGKTACIIFTRDCNFRCPFCHNAELVVGGSSDRVSEEDVLAYLEKRKNILDGVTVTGGEPLLQKGLSELIVKIRTLGYSVKLDTNGAFPERLGELLSRGLVDYVAMDIKNSPELYEKTVGVACNLEKIKKSISLIMSSGIDYEFRTTVVKGLHTEKSIKDAARLIASAEKYYLQSFVDSGSLINGEGLSAFDKTTLEGFAESARAFVKNVYIRGVD